MCCGGEGTGMGSLKLEREEWEIELVFRELG